MGQIITFYSYKGGTGRSMSLANVAYILATDRMYERKPILMIDWDLEAPGLHRFFQKDFTRRLGHPWSHEGYAGRLEDAGGLMDFVHTAAKIYDARLAPGKFTEREARHPDAVATFQEALKATEFDALPMPVDEIPNLRLLKAGRHDDDYANKVRKFDWEAFYKNYGCFFANFREYLGETYGYVLIDSRTGLTDTSGICTRVMPEKLVAVFAPNRQNIEGVQEVIRGAVAHRTESAHSRSLVAFPLASRIDSEASDLRTAWWKGGRLWEDDIVGYERSFEALFMDLHDLDECELAEYFDSTQVPHDKDYAYGERIAARSATGTKDKFSIGAACGNFTKRLVNLSAPWERLPDPAMEAERAKRRAEEEARAAKLEVEEARRRAEEEAHAARTARAKERVTRVISQSVNMIFALAFFGFVFFNIWQDQFTSGQRYRITQRAVDLAPQPSMDDRALRAWALAEVRADSPEHAASALNLIPRAQRADATLDVALAWSAAGRSEKSKENFQTAAALLASLDPSPNAILSRTHMAEVMAWIGDRSGGEAALSAATEAFLGLQDLGFEDWPTAFRLAAAWNELENPKRGLGPLARWLSKSAAGRRIRANDWMRPLAYSVGTVLFVDPVIADATAVPRPFSGFFLAASAVNALHQGDTGKIAALVKQIEHEGRSDLISSAAPQDVSSDSVDPPHVAALGLAWIGMAYALKQNQKDSDALFYQALGMANAIQSKQGKEDALFLLSTIFSRAHRPDLGSETAGRIDDKDGKAEALAVAAIGFARKGDLAKAERLLSGMQETRNRPAAVDALAVGYARAGDLNQARRVAEGQAQDARKLETYAHVLQAWIGLTDDRWKAFDQEEERRAGQRELYGLFATMTESLLPRRSLRGTAA